MLYTLVITILNPKNLYPPSSLMGQANMIRILRMDKLLPVHTRRENTKKWWVVVGREVMLELQQLLSFVINSWGLLYGLFLYLCNLLHLILFFFFFGWYELDMMWTKEDDEKVEENII